MSKVRWYEYRVIPCTEEELLAKEHKDNKPWRVQVTFIHPLYGECMLMENSCLRKDIYPIYISYKLTESGIIKTSTAEEAGIGNIPNRVFKEFGY